MKLAKYVVLSVSMVILFLGISVVSCLAESTQGVIICKVSDKEIACILPLNGIDYTIDQKDTIWGCILRLQPDSIGDCYLNKNDEGWNKIDCDEVAE